MSLCSWPMNELKYQEIVVLSVDVFFWGLDTQTSGSWHVVHKEHTEQPLPSTGRKTVPSPCRNLVPQSQHPGSPSTCPQAVRVPLGKEAHLVSKMKVEFSSVTQGFYSFRSLLSSDGRACFGNKKAWLAQTSPLWFDNLFWRVNHIWYKSTLHPFPALLDCNIPSFNQLIYVFRQVCEGFLHINGISGWRFNVLHAVCSSQFLCLMASHLPLCIQVTLVTHQNKYNLVGLNVYFGLF